MRLNLPFRPLVQPEAVPSIVDVNSTPKLQELLRDIVRLPTKTETPSIYLDVSRGDQDELIEIQLLALPTNKLYIVNKKQLKQIGTPALFAFGLKDLSLRSILGSRDIKKIGFDIRGMSKLLFDTKGVMLEGMWDLQLMEMASRPQGESKKFLSDLETCIDQDIPDSNEDKIRWLAANMTGPAPRPRMKRIEIFPALWDIYWRRPCAQTGRRIDWITRAQHESQKRADDARRRTGRQGAQDLGPKMWWFHEAWIEAHGTRTE